MNTEPRKTKNRINEMRDERREHLKTKNLINEMRDERRSQLHAQDYFKELPYYDLEKYDDLENEISDCEFSGLQLQVRIDQLSKKKHDLTILLQDPTFRSRKSEQDNLVRQQIKDLQTQIMNLHLELHENEERINALQTNLKSELKMHLNPENYKCKARTHGIEQNHNAANVYCVNLNN